MKTCAKCGGPISFKRLKSGKWCPTSVDGGDHWDECREWQAKGTYGVMNLNKRINHIGPVWTIGHNTPEHLKRIGPLHQGPDVPWET